MYSYIFFYFLELLRQIMIMLILKNLNTLFKVRSQIRRWPWNTSCQVEKVYCVATCVCVGGVHAQALEFSCPMTDMLSSLVQFSNKILIDKLDWLSECVQIPITKLITSFKITFEYHFFLHWVKVTRDVFIDFPNCRMNFHLVVVTNLNHFLF